MVELQQEMYTFHGRGKTRVCQSVCENRFLYSILVLLYVRKVTCVEYICAGWHHVTYNLKLVKKTSASRRKKYTYGEKGFSRKRNEDGVEDVCLMLKQFVIFIEFDFSPNIKYVFDEHLSPSSNNFCKNITCTSLNGFKT